MIFMSIMIPFFLVTVTQTDIQTSTNIFVVTIRVLVLDQSHQSDPSFSSKNDNIMHHSYHHRGREVVSLFLQLLR